MDEPTVRHIIAELDRIGATEAMTAVLEPDTSAASYWRRKSIALRTTRNWLACEGRLS
jgi:hypothetical protein